MQVYVRGGPEIMASPDLAVPENRINRYPDYSSFGGSGLALGHLVDHAGLYILLITYW